MSTKGALFIVQRGLHAAVAQLAPQRKNLANSYMGDPLDCVGGVINDLMADSHGGVYLWADRKAAEAWFTPEWAAQVKGRTGADPQVNYFNSPVQIDNRALPQ